MEPIFLEPVFKEVIWGGEALRTHFGYDIPSNKTGECWAVSGHQNGDCRIKKGKYAGRTLSWLWREHRECFGHQPGEQFPLLIKIIDAGDDLSIQVHPDDAYAGEHENGSLGKTECWYILDCEPGASIVVGHNAASKEELKEMIAADRWAELLRLCPIKKGDFFQIEPGTVHAIKRGTLILETQQSSDVTYRLYDYGRLQDGKPRPLHLAQSLDVVTCPYRESAPARSVEETEEYRLERLVSCRFYTVEHANVHGRLARKEQPLYEILDVLDGGGSINGRKIEKGDHFLLPCGYGAYELTGEMELMLSRP